MKIPILMLILVAAIFGFGFATARDSRMSFFLTSNGPGDGASLGGLAGADAHCQMLAESVGGGGKTWRAYLSTSGADGSASVNARDRIGTGPWSSANGVQVASDVADLHSDTNKLSIENSISESGDVINGRGDTPNRHDILTGSNLDGTAFSDDHDHTCRDWTYSESDGSAQVVIMTARVAVLIQPPGTMHIARAAAVRATCGAQAVLGCITVSRSTEIAAENLPPLIRDCSHRYGRFLPLVFAWNEDRYSAESSRSPEANFINLKDCKWPEADCHDLWSEPEST
jgi:hypothetical protein